MIPSNTRDRLTNWATRILPSAIIPGSNNTLIGDQSPFNKDASQAGPSKVKLSVRNPSIKKRPREYQMR